MDIKDMKLAIAKDAYLSDDPVQSLVNALMLISRIGCMQSKEEEEFWCKHDGSEHSIYCAAGIAKMALEHVHKGLGG